MKRIIIVLVLCLLPVMAWGQYLVAPVLEYTFSYEPDSTDLAYLTTTKTGMTPFVKGYDEWWWETWQLSEPSRTVLDSVQFSLWGWDGQGWDSLVSIPYTDDTASAAFPLHQGIIKADTVWVYDYVRIQARWIVGDSSLTAAGNTAPEYWSRLVMKRN